MTKSLFGGDQHWEVTVMGGWSVVHVIFLF